MNHWLVVTSPDNFKYDRAALKFKYQGLPYRFRKQVQISGNLTEAKDRLAQALKFNYRKVIMVLKEQDLKRLNLIMRHEPELRSWMEAWSIGSICEMYNAGEKFFKYYRKLKEAVYKDKKELELTK